MSHSIVAGMTIHVKSTRELFDDYNGALTPTAKACRTAKWARTMTKWLVTRSYRKGARWKVVDFCGSMGAESVGIVDLLAIRKDHRKGKDGLKRGDDCEIVLIQVKGGCALRPTSEDAVRLSKVGRLHRAKAIVLIEWQRKDRLAMFQLLKTHWHPVDPIAVFG
jgi:hypothetical protein